MDLSWCRLSETGVQLLSTEWAGVGLRVVTRSVTHYQAQKVLDSGFWLARQLEVRRLI
jgi:hypothetical protein